MGRLLKEFNVKEKVTNEVTDYNLFEDKELLDKFRVKILERLSDRGFINRVVPKDVINELIDDINIKAEVLILAGGDHLYWYNNARYNLIENTLYKNENQRYMLTTEMSDNYDKDALVTSLDRIRKNSDNPKWFDGSRAMKVFTNLISHKIDAKYIIPTKINMEDGLKMQKISKK